VANRGGVAAALDFSLERWPALSDAGLRGDGLLPTYPVDALQHHGQLRGFPRRGHSPALTATSIAMSPPRKRSTVSIKDSIELLAYFDIIMHNVNGSPAEPC
jgi:hypothetical protein